MKIITYIMLATLAQAAHAGMFSKKAADAEGNCIPALLTENARLYTEIENLDQIATRAEAQLKATVKESQKLGYKGLEELSSKSKTTRKAIASFGSTYGDATCKAQIMKKGSKNPEIITINIKQRVAELDKLALAYEDFADKALKSQIAKK